MIKTKIYPLFFSNNLKLKLFLKTVFLFSVGIYILSLPLLTWKFSLFDGVNWLGYTSPSFVLLGENIFCIFLSIISISWSYLTIKKLKGVMQNEIK